MSYILIPVLKPKTPPAVCADLVKPSLASNIPGCFRRLWWGIQRWIFYFVMRKSQCCSSSLIFFLREIRHDDNSITVNRTSQMWVCQWLIQDDCSLNMIVHHCNFWDTRSTLKPFITESSSRCEGVQLFAVLVTQCGSCWWHVHPLELLNVVEFQTD